MLTQIKKYIEKQEYEIQMERKVPTKSKLYLEKTIHEFFLQEQLLTCDMNYFTGLLSQIVPPTYTTEKVGEREYLVTSDREMQLRHLVNILADYKRTGEEYCSFPLEIAVKTTNGDIIWVLSLPKVMLRMLVNLYPKAEILEQEIDGRTYIDIMIPNI